MSKILQAKVLRIANVTLYIFSVWSVFVFWLRASGYIDADWLAFNLDSTHFWNRGFLYLLIISSWFLFASRKRIYKTEMERDLSFFFLLISITFDNVGNLLGWYRTDTVYGIDRYDQFVHFINSGFATGFFIVTFRNIYRESSYSLIILASIGIAVILGSLFEVGEYFSDLWSDTRMVGGVEDVEMDTLMNIGGAVFAGILSHILNRKR